MNISKHTFKHSLMFTDGPEHVDSESAIYRTVCSRKIYYMSATLSINSIECVFVAECRNTICVSVQIVNGI